MYRKSISEMGIEVVLGEVAGCNTGLRFPLFIWEWWAWDVGEPERLERLDGGGGDIVIPGPSLPVLVESRMVPSGEASASIGYRESAAALTRGSKAESQLVSVGVSESGEVV